MSILQNIPTPSFEFNAGLVDNRGALALVRQGQDITGQVAFPFVRNGVKNVPDKLGILRAVPANEPAVTFDSDGRNLGYLPESARTNGIRNNTMQGAVVGTPGTLPTNWTETLQGLTRQVVAIGQENGVDYIDIRFSGTASTTGGARISFDVVSGLLASTPYRLSFYVKRIDGTLTSTVNMNLQEFTDGTFVRNNFLNIASSISDALSRVDRGATTSATTNRITPVIQFEVTNGVSYDFTIRIGLPQLEQGSFASSVIKTTNATVTRPADILTYTDAQDFIGQSEGVIEVGVDVSKLLGSVNRQICSLGKSEGSGDFISLSFSAVGSNTIRLVINDNSVKVDFRSQITQVGNYKILARYQNSNNGVFVNSQIITPVVNNNFSFSADRDVISIGNTGGGSSHFNDPIRSVRLWKTADWCTDEVAQLLTRI
jgi:hypothetical protein